jgi:PqqD family protein of HPr-rel-A system
MAGPIFVADPKDCTIAQEADGLILLYHRPSGMTHILAPPAPQILEVLREQGDRDQVAERIAARFELQSDDPAAAVEARLAELEAAGLVRRL